jgi:hypothetical protein
MDKCPDGSSKILSRLGWIGFGIGKKWWLPWNSRMSLASGGVFGLGEERAGSHFDRGQTA